MTQEQKKWNIWNSSPTDISYFLVKVGKKNGTLRNSAHRASKRINHRRNKRTRCQLIYIYLLSVLARALDVWRGMRSRHECRAQKRWPVTIGASILNFELDARKREGARWEARLQENSFAAVSRTLFKDPGVSLHSSNRSFTVAHAVKL